VQRVAHNPTTAENAEDPEQKGECSSVQRVAHNPTTAGNVEGKVQNVECSSVQRTNAGNAEGRGQKGELVQR